MAEAVDELTGEAAEVLTARAEDYLNILHDVLREQSAPDLALCEWRHMANRVFWDRNEVRAHLADSLEAFVEGSPRTFMYRTRDGRYPPVE